MSTGKRGYRLPERLAARMKGKEFRVLARAWKVWRPPLDMSISDWADEYRRLPNGVTSEPGRYNSRRLPWARFILDAIGARRYRDHILVGASQVMGKTEILNCVVGYFIHAEPSPILVKYPTRDSVEAWSKAKLDPMIQATPVLRAIFGTEKSRDGNNTITEKKFPGGSLTMIGANSPSGMRQRSKKVVIQDEIDADEVSAGVEGDPTDLADKRAESYGDRLLLKSSTPTISGHSRCWKLLEKSTFHEWHAKCPACEKLHVLSLANLKWPSEKDENGKTVSRDVSKAYYECPECTARWDDLDRQRAIMSGQAIARHPEATTFGFHLNGLYKLIGGSQAFDSMLHEFAEGFLKQAAADRESKKVFRNTFEALPWEEEFEKLDEKAVLERAEDYDPTALLPAGVLRVEVGADVQEDRIEMEFVGYGEAEETWGLGYHVVHGDTQGDAVWKELDQLLARQFRHPCGKSLAVTTTFIDSGCRQDRVMQFTGPRKARGVYASKGYNAPGRPIPILGRKPSLNNKRKVPQWIVGVTAAKTVIYSRIMVPVPGAGAMHFPRGHGYDARYFRQLTSERRLTRYAQGKPYYIFEAEGRRNEPLDIRVYALAAHRRVMFDAVALTKALEVKAEEAPEREADETAAVKPSRLEGVEASPLVRSFASLPAYVPMSERHKGGGGASVFKV